LSIWLTLNLWFTGRGQSERQSLGQVIDMLSMRHRYDEMMRLMRLKRIKKRKIRNIEKLSKDHET